MAFSVIVTAIEDAAKRGVSVRIENFSFSSLRRNRELGIRTTNKSVIAEVSAVLAADHAGATRSRRSTEEDGTASTSR